MAEKKSRKTSKSKALSVTKRVEVLEERFDKLIMAISRSKKVVGI